MNKHRKDELKRFIRVAAESLGKSFLLSVPLPQSLPNRPRKTIMEHLHIETPTTRQARLEFVKWLVRFCAGQYMIDMPQIAVKFSQLKTSEAGHVFYKEGIWYVEIDGAYKWSDLFLTAIVAHEMAHVVLGLKNVRLEPIRRNEELTDTVSILAGFGKAAYAASLQEKVNPVLLLVGIVSVSRHKLGYLPRNEIIHLSKIKKRISLRRPVKRWRVIDPSVTRNVGCYSCSMILRVPDRTGKLIISCPVCQMRQRVVLRREEREMDSFIQKLSAKLARPFHRAADYFKGFDDFSASEQ